MSIIETINNLDILPNQILEELMKHETFQKSSSHTILALIENQWREENKEAFFDLFDQQGLWDNETQRDKIRKHLSHIHREVKQTYGSDFVNVYLTEMIDKIFPAQAESTHRIRAELQDIFS